MTGKTKITIEGKPVQLYYGLPANRMFFEAMDSNDRLLIGDRLTEAGIAALFHCGYINACMIYDLPEDLKRGVFIEYVDMASISEALKPEMENALKVYTESLYTKRFLDDVNGAMEDIKKKVSTGIASNHSATANLDYQLKTIKYAPSGNTGYSKKAMKGGKKRKSGTT